MGIETGWVIEQGGSPTATPQFFTGVPLNFWTADDRYAVRFMREVDAAMVAGTVAPAEGTNGAPHRTAERSWNTSNPPPPPPIPPPPPVTVTATDDGYGMIVGYGVAGQTIVVRPISYRQGREFRDKLAGMIGKSADALMAGGVPAIVAFVTQGLDARLLEMFDACCAPSLMEIDGLPGEVAGACFGVWTDLNTRADRWHPLIGRLEQVLTAMTGRPIRVKGGWSQPASPQGNPGQT